MTDDPQSNETTLAWILFSEAAPMLVQGALLAAGAGTYGIYSAAKFTGSLVFGGEHIALWLWKALGGLCFGAWGLWIMNRVWPKRHQPTAVHGYWGVAFTALVSVILWGLVVVLLNDEAAVPVPRIPALVLCGWLLAADLRTMGRLLRRSRS